MLHECTSFLDAVKVLDEEARLKSCLQFASSILYCCLEFSDTSSPDVANAITGALEKRKSWASSLNPDHYFRKTLLGNFFYRPLRAVLHKYQHLILVISKMKIQHKTNSSSRFSQEPLVWSDAYPLHVLLC